MTAARLIATTPKSPAPAFSAKRQGHEADRDRRLREHEERRQPKDDVARSNLQAVPEHVATPAVDVEMSQPPIELEYDRTARMLVVPNVAVVRAAEDHPV